MMPEDSSSWLYGGVAGLSKSPNRAGSWWATSTSSSVSMIVLPNLAEVGQVPDIFLKENVTALIDGHVVEHVAIFGAIEYGVNRAAEFGLADVKET